MSVSLDLPQVRKMIGELATRIGILERRTNPTGGVDPNSHSHAGTGSDSTVLSGASYEATATGQYATAAGAGADASDLYASAFGETAHASGVESTAMGANAEATGDQSAAFGASAQATHDASVAIGFESVTTNTSQVNLARRRVLLGAPNSAIADADLVTSQISFYLNQGSNTLVVKAKYSDGTVKTGTLALT